MAYTAAMEEVIALYALDVTQRSLTSLGDRGPTAYDKQHTSACRHDLAILGLRSHVIYLAFDLVKTFYLVTLLVRSGVALRGEHYAQSG